MALNVKQKYPGTQGGAAQLYASDTRLSLRRREQVFTRLHLLCLLISSRQCRRYLAYIFFVVTYMCSARLFCVWAPQVVFYCNLSCSRHVRKSANLIVRIDFDALRQTQKTNPRRFKKNDAFNAWRFSRRCAHSHWRPLFSHEALNVGEYCAKFVPVCTGL